MHAQWRAQDHEYYRAIWVECAELLDHYGWKWWKHQSADLEQVKLEIVDIWHFGLSELIRDGRISAGNVDAGLVVGIHRSAACRAARATFARAVEALAVTNAAQRAFPVGEFVDVMAALPIDLDELYRIYIGKNVLNNFRQANGYKSGSYVKVWHGPRRQRAPLRTRWHARRCIEFVRERSVSRARIALRGEQTFVDASCCRTSKQTKRI